LFVVCGVWRFVVSYLCFVVLTLIRVDLSRTSSGFPILDSMLNIFQHLLWR
jgi:hypothetical protein